MISTFIFMLPVQANEPTRSKYYNTVRTSADVNNGILEINNYYSVGAGTGFTSAEIHTYVERKVLGVIWVKVDNGQPNKTWVSTSTSFYYTKNYSMTLPQNGTYRVTAQYTFYGSSGSEATTRQVTVTY